MVYEIATLPIRYDRVDAFERAFSMLANLLAHAEGYEGHALLQGVEDPTTFTLVVRWRSIEDHTQRFELSHDHEILIEGLSEYLTGEVSVRHVRPTGSTELRMYVTM